MPNERYAVILTRSADREMQKLPEQVQRRIVRSLERLETNPRARGVIKLEGEADLYRLRVGDYRVVYRIQDDRLIVLVVRVAHRRDAHRGGG
ncbi:MAG: type II toxin-antitoxin system RelE/ParE family toxin [Planctomycetaceae bacterium]